MSGTGKYGAFTDGALAGARLVGDFQQRDFDNKRALRVEQEDQRRYDYQKEGVETERARASDRELAAKFAAAEGAARQKDIARNGSYDPERSAKILAEEHGDVLHEVANSHSSTRKKWLEGKQVDPETPWGGLRTMEHNGQERVVQQVNVRDPKTGALVPKPMTVNRTADPKDQVVPQKYSQAVDQMRAMLAPSGYVDAYGARVADDTEMARNALTLRSAVPAAAAPVAAPPGQPAAQLPPGGNPFAAVTSGASSSVPSLSNAVPTAANAAAPAEWTGPGMDPAVTVFGNREDPRTQKAIAAARADQMQARGADAAYTAGLDQAGHTAAMTTFKATDPAPATREELAGAGVSATEIDKRMGGALPPAVTESKTPEQQKLLTNAATKPPTKEQVKDAERAVAQPARGANGLPNFKQVLAAVRLGVKGEALLRYVNTGEFEKPELKSIDPEHDLYSNGRLVKKGVPKPASTTESIAMARYIRDGRKEVVDAVHRDIEQRRGSGKKLDARFTNTGFWDAFSRAEDGLRSRGLKVNAEALADPQKRAKIMSLYESSVLDSKPAGWFTDEVKPLLTDEFDKIVDTKAKPEVREVGGRRLYRDPKTNKVMEAD